MDTFFGTCTARCLRPTFLVVPLALHLLDDAEVEHGVPGGRAAAQRGQEVAHHGLVPRLARARQPGQVLQDQLLPVLRETLRDKWFLIKNIFFVINKSKAIFSIFIFG